MSHRPRACIVLRLCVNYVMLVALACAVGIAPASLHAQTTCPPPAQLSPSTAKNIFTDRQEVDLGDVLAEQFDRENRVLHDDDLSAFANGVAKNLVAHLPPNQLNFRVLLYNAPVLNAFSLPGGRIYLSRKIVAFVRNDDELAAVMAHEMGHILSHQGAIQMTALLHEVLGVDSVGDRKDIFDKVNRLYDNAARNPKAFEKVAVLEERRQYEADRVGLYALASAGYSPQALADFLDRLTETHGKTGNWITDVFGATKPNELRMREMRKSLEALPPGCLQPHAGANNDEFLKWQARVVAFSGSGRQDSLTGLIQRVPLNPPLRTDINYLKFSPDGQFALAQDDSSVFVLSRTPFQLLFRIDAPNARPAQFSPDSKSVTILTTSLRLETWDIESQERTSLHEFSVLDGCVKSLVSHDGKVLACVNSDLDFSLFDVSSGSPFFTKKQFFEPQSYGSELWRINLLILAEFGDVGWIHLEFSPDDHYFVGAGANQSLAVDLKTRSQTAVPGALADRASGGFIFTAPDRVVAVDDFDPQKSAVIEFPSGKVLENLPINPRQSFWAPSHGNYLIMAPVKGAVVGVLDMASQKFILGMNQSLALDVYDQTLLAEKASGELGLFDLSTHRLEGVVQIPESPLGRLQTWAVSPDLHWLAVSARSRGAVWNLSDPHRLYYLRGFWGSYFDGDRDFYSDFPKKDPQVRTIARASLSSPSVVPGLTIEEKTYAHQYGPFLVTRKTSGKGSNLYRNVSLEVQDVRDGHTLWTCDFPKEVPAINLPPPYDSLILDWPIEASAVKDEVKAIPGMKDRLSALHDRAGAYLVEVLDPASGKSRGQLLVDTGKGSFRIRRAYAEGDWVLIGDAENRTHVYSLATGEEKTTFFGTDAILSSAAGLLVVENESGQVDVYDLKSLEKRSQLTFHYNISAGTFSADGKRLFILTSNQNAYLFDTQALDRPETPASSVATKQ